MRSLLLKEIPYITFTEDFARGFVSKCASQGLSIDQTIQLLDATRSSECVVKYATTKTAAGLTSLIASLFKGGLKGAVNAKPHLSNALSKVWSGIKSTGGWAKGDPVGALVGAGALGGAGYGIHRYMQKDPTDISYIPSIPGGGDYFKPPATTGPTGGIDPLKSFGELNNAFPPTQAGFQAAAKDMSTGRPKYQDHLDSIERAMASEKDAGRLEDLKSRKTDLLISKRDAGNWSKEVGGNTAFKVVKNMAPESAMNLQRRADLPWYNPAGWFGGLTPTDAGKYYEDYKAEQTRLRPALRSQATIQDHYGL